MHLSGQLSDWSINDLLQIMQVTKKTGSLDIDGERHGRIHFREGEVTGAELSGEGGSHVGGDRSGIADVLYVLSTLDSGSFSVGPADGPDTDGWSVEDILTDVEALKELESEVMEAGLFEAAGVRLANEIESALTIDPSDWWAVASLVRPFSLSDLESELGRGGAVRVLHALHRLEIAEPHETNSVEEEGESGWLDRLAEDIAPESDEPTWVEESTLEVPDEELEVLDEEEVAALEEESPVEVEPVEPASADLATVEVVPPADVRGVSAPASTTLTDGVYDEIRRLRSKVADS